MNADPRLTPARPDLAAAQLRGTVDAARFVDGTAARVAAEVLDMRGQPDPDAALTSQLLYGEAVTVYECRDGVAWVQSGIDGYVGYVAEAALDPKHDAPATHMVTAQHAQLYDAPELKRPPRQYLPQGARLSIVAQAEAETLGGGGASSGRYVQTDTGLWCPAQQVTPLAALSGDPATLAERYIGTPYLWGGRSARGLDCSALVQLVLSATGSPAPRDSDMFRPLGTAVEGAPRRGDLVCWRGHIGIMLDATRLLHANAHHMCVAVEPLAEAITRIAATETGPVLTTRRLG